MLFGYIDMFDTVHIFDSHEAAQEAAQAELRTYRAVHINDHRTQRSVRASRVREGSQAHFESLGQ